jgi:hypothetical protein
MHRLVIALVTLLGLAAAAFVAGYLLVFSVATDRAAALAPANSAFYANVYLQPSTGQQMNLSELIGRLPGFADDASLDEKVDQVVQNLLSDTGIDYREQIKPWLGNQLAVAGWPGTDGVADPLAVVIADVKDMDAAQDAVGELVADAGAAFTTESHQGTEIQVSETGSYAFVDDMLVIGESAESIRAVIDVAGGAESLADVPAFVATMESLEPDHLASAYVDIAAIGEAAEMSDQVAAVSTAGAVLVAEPDGLRLSGSAPFDEASAGPSEAASFALGGEPSSLVDWMPADTVAEAVVFGLRQTLENAETALGAAPEGEEVIGTLDTLRALAALGLGIDLDNDLLPLLDREVAVAIHGFDGTLPSGQILLRPSDPDAASAALGRLADGLTSAGATRTTVQAADAELTVLAIPDVGEVAYAIVDDIVILGLGVDDVVAAIEAHATGDSLGMSERYTRTFEVAGTRGGSEAYVDVGAALELLGEPAELPADARDILLQVGTVAATVPSRDDQIEFHAVLTIDP